MARTKKTAAKEPQIVWQPAPPATTFIGTIPDSDLTYRITTGYTDDGEFTWVTDVQLSDNKPRTLEEAKDLAEKDHT